MTQAQPRKKQLFNMNVDLMHGPILKSLLLFMLPILVSNLFQQLYNTVDTMIVGNVLGDTALAAIGSCGSIYELLVGFGIGIGNGLAIVAARSYGAQDEDLLKRTVTGSIVIGLIASLVITTAGFFGLRPLLQLLGTDPDIMADSRSCWTPRPKFWRTPTATSSSSTSALWSCFCITSARAFCAPSATA